jgi:LuxR family maltose regulon positive regulatory protein
VYGDRVALNRALGLLAQQGQQAERCGLLWRRIKALALQALALEALGETAGALAALEQAVVLAEPERYVRLFVDEGPPMRGLLRQLQARGSPAQYSTSLLRAFGPEGSMNRPSSPPGSVGSIEPPTEPQPWCSRPPWLFPIA